ncbi:DUF6057 family protein [Xylanibacter oryzae]|uniref:DUF6057 family protein n=1 Tax=Xylanibacter oryzae TaxID=185293 RepID=UPI0004B49F31|nr:DUF6057 family protein [Xylanibacter oryzae]
MKTFISKYWEFILSVFFGVAVFIFWDVLYPCYLSYQEQFQLFLFDGNYFMERIIVPGGLADYIAEFLTQFYYITCIGACILAIILVFIQRMSWVIAKHEGAVDEYYVASFIPALFLWVYMGDENVLLSFALACLVSLIICWGYIKLEDHKIYGLIYLLLIIPSFYWLFGSTVLIFVVFAIINIIKSERLKISAVGYSFCTVVYTLAWMLFVSTLIQYPMFRIFGGINYYRFPVTIPDMQIVTMIVLIIFPLLVSLLPHSERHKTLRVTVCITVTVLLGFFGLRIGFNPLKYELIDYDYLVRYEQWDKIISKAERHQPSTPMGVASVNLALAEKDVIGDRMFDFYQNGAEGLLPSFQRDFTSPLCTSEAFYRLGMINTAQRFMFEAQEAIPNFRKSGRCTKRLAETNLINGQYAVAAKYLRILQKSLFYKGWANNMMTYLYNEKKINSDPVYGKLRRYRYTKDFLYSDTEMDQMLGLLFARNLKNKMAFEYLMGCELLNRDLQKFLQFYPLGKYTDFDHIPRSYQEALVYIWTQSHKDFNGIPWGISNEVANDVTDFARAYISNPNDPSLIQGHFGQTYWSYYLLKKKK